MEDFRKKLEQLIDLAKALAPKKPGQNALVPALKLPSPKPLSMPSVAVGAPTKLPGAGPASTKDPKAMAAQLKNPRPKKPKIEVMKTAVNGQWRLEKDDDEQHYRIHVDGQPVTHPMPLGQIQSVHGSVKHIESKPGHLVVPHTPKSTVKNDSGTMSPDDDC